MVKTIDDTKREIDEAREALAYVLADGGMSPSVASEVARVALYQLDVNGWRLVRTDKAANFKL